VAIIRKDNETNEGLRTANNSRQRERAEGESLFFERDEVSEKKN